MSQYITTQQQNILLNLPYDTKQLKLLQKNTISKIQVVSFKGMKAIKSIEDSYMKIRIIITSMLIKIYQQYNSVNIQRIYRIKKIIYSSKLTKICQTKGLIRQNLLKSIAIQLNLLKISHNIQKDIIKLFNCSPFFDQIIINAFIQQNPILNISDCQIEFWFDREMFIKIIWNDQYYGDQNQDMLVLVGLGEYFHANKDCKSEECHYKSYQQYLKYIAYQINSNINTNDEEINQIYDQSSKNQLFSCPLSPQDFGQQNNYSTNIGIYTIDSMSPTYSNRKQKVVIKRTPEIKLFQSPASPYMSTIRRKSSQNYKNNQNSNQQQNQHDVEHRKQDNNCQEIKLIQNTTRYTNRNTVQYTSNNTIGNKQIKIKRKNKKEKQGSSLWRILCCGNI